MSNTQTNRAAVATNTFSAIPGASQDLELLWVHVVYTATATVGNRFLEVDILDAAGNGLGDWHNAAAQTAGQAGYHIEFMQGAFRETTFDANHIVQTTIPIGVIVPLGCTLRIRDGANIDVADSMTITYQVRTPAA